ncbi:Protein of uncharacterised function (DUF2834) [Kingella potus]|uniref:Protein of uncharacterized function (DUF2834) n=1 Tax=Kingella potus TaxID=265175 RepID=A0A377R1Y2_9NEIS|nr:DUF2834 domain-containing protein [Kingella potus]UOP01267.1 DUF2834 domain-containing protein [Kingella potus]STR01000.1 Protein of uncharacterised function (DUF2834) [Kingella potus]
MVKLYVLLCLVGAVLPLTPFCLFVVENGLDAGLFFKELFDSRTSTFFALDVIISALVFIAFAVSESFRLGKKQMMWSVLGLAVGVSFALPLFLLLRETAIRQEKG